MHEWDFMVKFKYGIFLIPLIFLSGCFWSDSSEQKVKLHIINVLPKELYDDCHIKGSEHVDYEDVEAKIASMNPKDHYVIYCADYLCMSSQHVAKMMIDRGFSNVWEYSGGIVEWYQKQYPVEGPCAEEYLTQDNEPLSGMQHEVPVITSEELLEKIQEFEK